jgi:hypothetical protein
LHILKKRIFFHKVGEELKLNKEIHLAYKILKKLDSNPRSDLTRRKRQRALKEIKKHSLKRKKRNIFNFSKIIFLRKIGLSRKQSLRKKIKKNNVKIVYTFSLKHPDVNSVSNVLK